MVPAFIVFVERIRLLLTHGVYTPTHVSNERRAIGLRIKENKEVYEGEVID